MNDQPAGQQEHVGDLHHRLIGLLLKGGGLDTVAGELAACLGRPVLIANSAGATLAGQLPPEAQSRFDELVRRPTRDNRHADQSLQAYARRARLLLVPLLVQNEVEGLLVTEASQPEVPDESILDQGATVATLALIKHQAVQNAEQRLRRDLLEDLLSGERWTVGRLTEQARVLGWQLDAKPVVVLLDFGEVRRYSLNGHGPDQSRLRWVREQFLKIVQQALAERNPDSIMVERGDGFIILPHLPVADVYQAREQAKGLVEAIAQQVRSGGLNVRYTIAGGGVHSGVEGLRHSYREAQQAMEIGARLLMRRPIWFDEVYLYLLLDLFSRSAEVHQWFNRTLGALVEYDRRNKTQMVQTLEVYFDTSHSLQQAAQALHVHPNTLKYRLQRIKKILGQDPFRGENQLQFYLATKVARLLE
jgi:purine catabolism regulator